MPGQNCVPQYIDENLPFGWHNGSSLPLLHCEYCMGIDGVPVGCLPAHLVAFDKGHRDRVAWWVGQCIPLHADAAGNLRETANRPIGYAVGIAAGQKVQDSPALQILPDHPQAAKNPAMHRTKNPRPPGRVFVAMYTTGPSISNPHIWPKNIQWVDDACGDRWRNPRRGLDRRRSPSREEA